MEEIQQEKVLRLVPSDMCSPGEDCERGSLPILLESEKRGMETQHQRFKRGPGLRVGALGQWPQLDKIVAPIILVIVLPTGKTSTLSLDGNATVQPKIILRNCIYKKYLGTCDRG